MTAVTMTNAPEASDLLSGGKLEQPKQGRRRPLMWMILATILVVVVAAVVGTLVVRQRSGEIVSSLERRLDIQAAGRAEVIETWLDGTARLAGQIVNSDSFRLFAVDAADSADPLAAALSDQAPYMGQVLTEFVQQNDLDAAYLLGPSGRLIVTSAGAPDLDEPQRTLGARVIETGEVMFSPIRVESGELTLDVIRPVRALEDPDGTDQPTPVAAFVFTVPAGAAIADLLAPSPLAGPGERTVLVQRDAATGTLSVVVPTEGGAEVHALEEPAGLDALAAAATALPFGERTALEGAAADAVFSTGQAVAGVPWLVVQEVDRGAALAPLGRTRLVVIIVGALASLMIAAAMAAVTFLESSEHNRALAEQFRALAARIDAQRRLLSGINGSIREWIGVKRLDGTYSYVNPAFADAFGRSEGQIVGQHDDALFGHGTAQRLIQSDRQAVETGDAVASEEQVHVAGTLRHLEISKVPLRRDDGQVDGIVSVARDVTELVEQRQKREAAVRRTIDALVRTVELSDPYLAGHSRLLNGFSLLVARRLGLPDEDQATLDMASLLSQVGKAIVPREILNKPERLTPDEIRVMEMHIDHARTILQTIEFELPVTETVYQMYERLDGSGYPNRLAGDAISMRSRILGACDVFCARIRPRSYRSSIPPEQALSILADHPEKYDASVVAALQASIRTTEGEKLLLVAQAA